jgi:hypothetical protein
VLDYNKLTTKKRQIAIGGYVKKLLKVSLLTTFLLAIPFTVLADGTAFDRALNAGWVCDDVAGAWHCFDPGDGRSRNSSTANVKVFNYDGDFLGTEQIWLGDLWAGQPCPQDALVFLPFGVACHHYAH